MKKIKFISFILLFLISNCSDEINNNDVPQDALIKSIIFSNDLQRDSIYTDNLAIKYIEIINYTLVIEVNYGGGCKNHSFNLFSQETFSESNPVQLLMRLFHNSHGDLCKVLITEKLFFDLQPVIERYNSFYNAKHGTVLLTISNPDFSITYSPKPEFIF